MRYLFLFILVSCAWNEKELQTIKRPKEDLIKTFETDKSVAAKFAEKEIKPQKRKKKRKKLSKKAVIKKIENKVEKSRYPKDYPQKYIEYNKKYKNIWEQYNPLIYVGEESEYDVTYIGINIGKIILRTLPMKMIGNRETFHFRADLKSAPYYSLIYDLNDYIETFVDAETILPLKYILIQRESGTEVDDLQLFDYDKFKTQFFYKRLKDDKVKKEEKTKYIPAYFHDTFSVIQFVRGLPLEIGQKYEFPLVNRAKIQIVKYTVESIEEKEIMNKKISALKIKAETYFPGVKKKKGDITLWMSNDESRRVLKYTANVKIGTVRGLLVRYEEGVKQ